MVNLQRVTVIPLALTVTLLASAPDAAAGGRRARLSEDLRRRIAAGDLAETDVIVTGASARVDAIAGGTGSPFAND
jgi:hypothetical protein